MRFGGGRGQVGDSRDVWWLVIGAFCGLLVEDDMCASGDTEYGIASATSMGRAVLCRWYQTQTWKKRAFFIEELS